MTERIFARKPSPELLGACLLTEDGVPCSRPASVRGVCASHAGLLRERGLMEALALPSRVERRATYAYNKDAGPDMCAALKNGEPCGRLAEQGTAHKLCQPDRISLAHANGLAPFERPLPEKALYRNKKPVSGECVIREGRGGRGGKVPCREKSAHRGLCARHYAALTERPLLLESLADPTSSPSVLAVDPQAPIGRCAVTEDGAPCPKPGVRRFRRACDAHFEALKHAGRLGELTQPKKRTTHRVFERKPEASLVPGLCLLLVNGVPCTGVVETPGRRGICRTCTRHLEKENYEVLALPPPPRERRKAQVTRKRELSRGSCVLEDDGVPCTRAPYARGVCKVHYERDRRLPLSLNAEELATLREVPHVYLDKNVLVRFATFELLASGEPDAAVALVRGVLGGRFHATVSLDAVRATKTHLARALALGTDVGGKGLDEESARSAARARVGEVFFGRGGLWHFAPPAIDLLRGCTTGGLWETLSLEDALEVATFKRAQEEDRTLVFVTSDRLVLAEVTDAVSPDAVVSLHAESLR